MSKLKSNEELAKQFGESREKIRRYIRLTELIPELLELVDNSLIKNSVLTIGVTSAVEMSYLSKDAQKLLYGVKYIQKQLQHYLKLEELENYMKIKN